MRTYHGHRSWNSWNVSMWIFNDRTLYDLALACLRESGDLRHAVRLFLTRCICGRTPDGAVINELSVRLAMRELGK